jgi:hypothetical protein
MIGVSVPNSHLEKFHDAVEQGQLLMLIDVPKDRVDHITNLVKNHHPEAKVQGTEPTIPAFP